MIFHCLFFIAYITSFGIKEEIFIQYRLTIVKVNREYTL
nr:MAG TPA: hypothetical protein [Caudoviricetes sp.]DAO32106.1 MAG TPA: hypothetical protein [Caudoviricetes sp.]